MLVKKIKREEFDILDDGSLGSACFQPLLQAYKDIRTRRDDEIRFYSALTKGQRSLFFIFRAYHEHVSKSPADLYWWSAYFMAQAGRWPSLKRGLSYFEDHEAVSFVEDIEKVLIESGHPASVENFNLSAQDLQNDPDMLSSFNSFYARYQQISPATIQRIGQYIRSNSSEFILYENQ